MKMDAQNSKSKIVLAARLFLFGVAAITTSVALPSRTTAQQVMTPTLLRRLAEAVDGHRTGNGVWVVAEWAFPNRVTAVVSDSATADSIASGVSNVGLFGPYVAPRDTLAAFNGFPPRSIAPDTIPDIVFGDGGCIHNRRSDMKDEIAMCPPEFFPVDSVLGFELVYRLIDRTVTVPLRRTTDAIFLTVPAIDKFVLPYYSHVLGLQEALRRRTEMLVRLTNPS